MGSGFGGNSKEIRLVEGKGREKLAPEVFPEHGTEMMAGFLKKGEGLDSIGRDLHA